MKLFILFLYYGFCISLSHAQTAPPITVPNLPNLPTSLESIIANPGSTPPTTTPTTTTSAPSTTSIPPTVDPLTGLPTQPAQPPQVAPVANVNGPKYIEYQSVCRTREYDQVQYLNDALKEKRIQFLADKNRKEPDSIKLKTRLLKEYVDQKKSKDVEQILKEIRPLKVTSQEMQYAEALGALSKGDKKQARELLNKILAEQPNNVEALKLIGEIYKEDANFFEYESIYYDLAKITKENYDEQLCEAYTLDSHYADAEKVCNKGIAEGKNPVFNIFLGVAAREKENLQEAQRQFINSLKIKETEMGLVCSGEVYLMQKKFDKAEELFQKAIKVNPKSLRAYVALAWTFFYDKKQTEALIWFENACSLNKKSISEIRKAVKILVTEKSDLIRTYSSQIEKCGNK